MENTIPIDKEESSNSALHFFLYLVLYLSLAFMSSGVGSILYQLINKFFLDTNGNNLSGFSNSAAKYGIASLVISAPIFFYLSWLIAKYLWSGKIHEDSLVRKWLSYVVLFVAAGTIIGDLITLIFNVLDGTAIPRFLLKVLVIILIAGSIFGFYLWDMRKKDMSGKSYKENRLIAYVYGLVVLIVFISGFFIIDSPVSARNRILNQNIINEMQQAQYEVDSYYQLNKKLPNTIADLNNTMIKENFGKFAIIYKKTGTDTYNFCANFSSSYADDSKYSDNRYYQQTWNYEKGNFCLDRRVNSDIPLK